MDSLLWDEGASRGSLTTLALVVAALGLVGITATALTRVVLRPKGASTATSSTMATTKPVDDDWDIIAPLPWRESDIVAREPQPYRPWKSGKFIMTMGIQKVKPEEWLDIDNRFWKEQELRRKLLEGHREGVSQMLPGSEAACVEVLDTVVDYVTRRYPNLFYAPEGKADYIHNSLTKRTFKITAPYDMPPLEAAAQLVMEDLNVMIQGFGDDDPQQHYLAASFSMAPAGWHLEDRIGWPLWKIHTPVPLWEDKLRLSIEKFFVRMKPGDIVSRQNFFMQTNDVLFQQEPFADAPGDNVDIEQVRIRHERQTLRRLPRTRAILFTVRTYLTRVVDLEDEPESIRELLGAIEALPDNMARYKGRPIWGEAVESWCKKQLENS